MENYRTLSFSSLKEAEKNKEEIDSYFKDRLINSVIDHGIDERGDTGFYVSYDLRKRPTNI